MNNKLIAAPDFNLNGQPLAPNHNHTLPEYDQYRITDLTPIPEPEPVITISGQIYATIEDIFCIAGQPKSGKSSVQNMFIAQSISTTGTIPDGVEGVQVLPNTNAKAVILMDTEQARHRQQSNVRNITRRAGFDKTPDHFLSYNIRQLDLENYVDVTTGICEAAFDKFNGIHSVWIDGGADYTANVNDEESSNAMIKYFEWLAIEFHTAVFVIVHTNPGSDKERGHFGSQMQRKSGGTLLVKEDLSGNDTSTIELKRLRYGGAGSVPLLTFQYDSFKGYHVGTGSKQINGITADDKAKLKITEAFNFSEMIFSGQKSLSGDKAIRAIMVKKACQERTAKGIFALMNASEMILKGSDNNYRINMQYNNELQ